MDIPNNLLPTFIPYRGQRDKRGTILVRTPRLTEEDRKKWYGAAPTPLPETDKNFRPDTIKF